MSWVFFEGLALGAPRTAGSPGPSPLPGASPSPALLAPPSVASLLRPELYKRLVEDKEILTSASLDGERYSFYATMLVHSGLERTRRILTDYSLYSKLVPYVDSTVYSPIMRVLDVQGGVWKWKLRSWVRFDERGDRWIHFTIVGGHFRGLEGDMFFESAGDKGTLVYFRGEQRGRSWPPKFVIERGAEIVFGFTAGRMRKYLESNEDDQGRPNGQNLPQPRSHL
jgi:hypothetical protein